MCTALHAISKATIKNNHDCVSYIKCPFSLDFESQWEAVENGAISQKITLNKFHIWNYRPAAFRANTEYVSWHSTCSLTTLHDTKWMHYDDTARHWAIWCCTKTPLGWYIIEISRGIQWKAMNQWRHDIFDFCTMGSMRIFRGITGCWEGEFKSSSWEWRKQRAGVKDGVNKRVNPLGRRRVGEMAREFNPCLSCLEAIVALSQNYQLSYQLDLIRTFHTFHTVDM